MIQTKYSIMRGTTPTITFRLPVSGSDVLQSWLTFVQDKQEVFTKTLNESEIITDTSCPCETKYFLKTTLSQENTLALTADVMLFIQLRILTTDGAAPASETFQLEVTDVLKDGVIE